jgi:multisubunit Na+/H+ antiporter MnhG subunit
MSATTAISYLLLAAGVGFALFAVAGMAAMSDVYARLHYLAPSTMAGLLIAAAIWVREGPSMIALQATLLAGFLLIAAPALAHGTARSARIAEHGDWRAQRGESVETEER